MAKTLDEALSQLFGTSFQTENVGTEPTDTASSLTYSQVVAQIQAAYQNAKAAAQQGNWADYGRYLDQLEQAINQLAAADSTAQDNSAAAADPAMAEAPAAQDAEAL